MNVERMVNHLGEVADWRTLKWIQKRPVLVPVRPDREIITNVLASPTWPLAPIERVLHAPVFVGDGTLVVQSGYHESGRIYLALPPGVEAPVSPQPSPGEVEAAKSMILTEMMRDFPFVSEADRAHALAAALLPFIRAMITGPTPFHLINAPTKGTGKTLLAQVVTHPLGWVQRGSSQSRPSPPSLLRELSRTLMFRSLTRREAIREQRTKS